MTQSNTTSPDDSKDLASIYSDLDGSQAAGDQEAIQASVNAQEIIRWQA